MKCISNLSGAVCRRRHCRSKSEHNSRCNLEESQGVPKDNIEAALAKARLVFEREVTTELISNVRQPVERIKATKASHMKLLWTETLAW